MTRIRSIAESYERQHEADGSVDWNAALQEGQEIFAAAATAGDWRCFSNLLEAFGTGGQIDDFLIAFSAPNLVTPRYWRFDRWEFPEWLDWGVTEDEYHDARLYAAQVVARAFYNWDEEQQQRFYHAMVWSRDLQVSSIPGLMKVAEETAAGFEESQGDEQWWYVRTALLVMYSTRELPTFDEFTLEAVRDAFGRWEQRPGRYSLIPSRDGLFWQRVPEILSDWSGRDLRETITTPFPNWQFDRVSPVVVLDHAEEAPF